MRKLKRVAAALLALAVVATACTHDRTEGARPPSSPSSSSTPSASRAKVPTGPHSAAAVMQRLCEAPKVGGTSAVTPEGPTPAAIAQVEREVETVRELKYTKHVAVEPVTQAQIDRRILKSFDKTYPAEFYARRSKAWGTIGVIPAGTSIRSALLTFQTGQVVGFYNPENGVLVYIGDTNLDVTERFVLAHELTHAIDDQNFGLRRLDSIAATCDDEAFMAAIGAVEGSAQFFATQVTIRFPLGDFGGLGGGGGSVAGVPPFITSLELWPYTVGMAFIRQLDQKGGTTEVNTAIQNFPVSTEQVIHPDRYPADLPIPVNVPDLGPTLGASWTDLDVMEVGEAWLQLMLELRLSRDVASTVTTGWSGGLYRAWADDSGHVAVVLRTVWDTPRDAQQFAGSLRDWLAKGDGQAAFVNGPTGSYVDVAFATDAGTLSHLQSALG